MICSISREKLDYKYFLQNAILLLVTSFAKYCGNRKDNNIKMYKTKFSTYQIKHLQIASEEKWLLGKLVNRELAERNNYLKYQGIRDVTVLLLISISREEMT